MATAIAKKGRPTPVIKREIASSNGGKLAHASRLSDDGTPPPGVENLDKVRDILFGAQMRDSDRRFAQMEERLAKDVTDLREENRKRLDSLEAFVKKELGSLLERVKSEVTARGDAIKSVGQDIKAEASQRNDAIKGVGVEIREAVKSVTEQIRAADDKSAEGQRELRGEIAEQTKSLREETTAAITAGLAAAKRTSDELRDEKTDRSALAELFTDMAMQLNSEGPAKKGR